MKITELVNKYDPQNQFNVIKNSYNQVEFAWNNEFDLSRLKKEKIKNIVISGLGGSAISGDLFLNYIQNYLTIPYFVNRNYHLPNFVDENSFVILSSYSGNTEETLSAGSDALKRGAQIFCITTNGKLEHFANEHNIFIAKLPKGYQPRYALLLNLFTLIKTFQILKLIPMQDKIVKIIVEYLKQSGDTFSRDNNRLYKIAESLIGFVPVIYSVDGLTSAIGVRLKSQFNENSKLHAFQNVLPEMNHNEIIGWETFSEYLLNAKVIFILDRNYRTQIIKRIKITSELIKKEGAEIINLESNFDDFRMRLIDLVYQGDWISYYLSLLRKQDPSEIKNIIYLKEKLLH